MGRTLGIFVSFVVLLGAGAGLTVAAWPHAQSDAVMGSDEKLENALAHVSPGMPVSQLAKAGLDVARARRLSALGLMEAFLPKNSMDFDSLDPALQSCFQNRDGCDGYVFKAVGSEALIVAAHGRVSLKMMLQLPVAKLQRARRMAGLVIAPRSLRN
jgi:hypothetical protein